jgi:hypothetical protein
VVLTNSWRGSGLIKRVVNDLGLIPPPARNDVVEEGLYALGSATAEIRNGWVTDAETDPVNGAMKHLKYRVSFDATLMSHRVDFPRPGVARVGWVALPRRR